MVRGVTKRLVALTLVGSMVLWAPLAIAVDIETYQNLLEAADAAHTALENAPGEAPVSILEEAADRDRDVIDWLDAFIASDEYSALSANQQGAFVRGRYRAEYNLSGVLIRIDRCAEARSRVRALLDSEVNDPELRPRLVERYDESNECLTRARTANLLVFASPEDANVLVDGVFVGTADVPQVIDLGEHRVTVRADGYYDAERTITASEENETIQIGPILLEELPNESAPTWYEWTLWGAGAVGVTLGVIFFFRAKSLNDDLNNPNFDVANREEAEDSVTQRRIAGGVFLGVGVLAAIAGTWSYIARQNSDDEAETEQGVSFYLTPTGVLLDWRF